MVENCWHINKQRQLLLIIMKIALHLLVWIRHESFTEVNIVLIHPPVWWCSSIILPPFHFSTHNPRSQLNFISLTFATKKENKQTNELTACIGVGSFHQLIKRTRHEAMMINGTPCLNVTNVHTGTSQNIKNRVGYWLIQTVWIVEI